MCRSSFEPILRRQLLEKEKDIFSLTGFVHLRGTASRFGTLSRLCVMKVDLMNSRCIRGENGEKRLAAEGLRGGGQIEYTCLRLTAHLQNPAELKVREERGKLGNGGASFTLVITVRECTASARSLRKTGVLP